MKKGLSLLCGLLIFSVCSCGTLCACDTNEPYAPAPAADSEEKVDPSDDPSSPEEEETAHDPKDVKYFVERKIPYYSLTATAKDTGTTTQTTADATGEETKKEYTVTAKKITSRKTYTINNETIPYVSIFEFIGRYINLNAVDSTILNYQATYEGDVVKVVNPVNSAYFEFNTLTRVVTYHNFEMFFNTLETNVEKYTGGLFGCPLLDDKLITYDYYPGQETLSYSLADYSIKDYVYRGNVYLPYETLCVLFNQTEFTMTDAYADNAFYSYSYAADEKGLAAAQYIRDLGTDWITQEYLLSEYNNLALALDMGFGLDQHESRVTDGKVISYMTKGAYSMLEPYKERLLSTELNVSNDAFCELLRNDLDDGGHTFYSFNNFLSNKAMERIDASGAETHNTLNTIAEIKKAREANGNCAKTYFPNRIYCNGFYKEYNDTAYIQFDSFTKTLKTKQEYIDFGINDENYPTDSISLFYYANEKIQSNANIKNVVIDLSANSGGVVYASEYIASWVCGGNNGVYRNTKTGSFIKYRVEADVNFDGSFNEKDYLSPDINVYIIISNGSFSCANKLPCHIQDNRKKNTYFIGSRTGGGSCCVDFVPFAYLGATIRLSGSSQIGRINATQDNFISNESGVEADYIKIANTDYASFANIEGIISQIKSHA